MSFLTALSLSFKNLLTKKGRTLMTAFAGSIGIIGIAAILSLANGVNSYIANVEEETLSEYPLPVSYTHLLRLDTHTARTVPCVVLSASGPSIRPLSNTLSSSPALCATASALHASRASSCRLSSFSSVVIPPNKPSE